MRKIKFLGGWKTITIAIFMISLQGELKAFSRYDFSKHYFYGGHLGVELGLINQYEVSPAIGYRILPRWNAGIGIKYQYYNNRRIHEMFSAHLYAPMAFTDFVLIRDLDDLLPFNFLAGAFFIHAQVDYFSLPSGHFDLNNEHAGKNRFFRPTWLPGAGIRTAVGHNGFFQLLIMMDVSDHTRAVYSNPVIRFGLFF